MSGIVVPVSTSSRVYDVVVGCDVLGEVGERIAQGTRADAAFVITDSNVGPLHLEKVRASLEAAGIYAGSFAMPAGEQNKRLSTLEDALEAMAACGLTRDSVVVVLGGGVVGDVAGFAAAVYMRGIQVVQLPTTLLAMVDSSVGGKTAVDASRGKNLIGAFLQPTLVVADVSTLATLTPEVFVDGIGEIVKHAVLADPALFDELIERPLTFADAKAAMNDEAAAAYLEHVVATNVAIKRDVVGADERERGLRQTLNLGHTIGHAIEAASGYTLGHGHCVAAGLCCLARATERLGWSEAGLAERIERCCAAQGLPIDSSLPHDDICRQAFFDKKRHGDRVNVVVPIRIGACEMRSVSQAEFDELVRLGCGVGRGV